MAHKKQKIAKTQEEKLLRRAGIAAAFFTIARQTVEIVMAFLN